MIVYESLDQLLNEWREPVFNRHANEFNGDFTIEFNVKNPDYRGIPDKAAETESMFGSLTNKLGEECFDEIKQTIGEREDWYIEDWSFAGRMNGWYALLCQGTEESVSEDDLNTIESIVEKYFKSFNTRFKEYYKNQFNQRKFLSKIS